MSNSNYKGNLTTIVKFIIMTVAPYLGVAEATQNQLIAVTMAAIGLILAYWDAKYDNTLINQSDVIEITELPSDIQDAIHEACNQGDDGA